MKNLDYYVKQVRKKFPNYTESQVLAAAQSAYEADPESTYKKPKVSTGKVPKPTFDITTEEDDGLGISLGFGTDGIAVPAKMSSYVVGLMKTNPKAYANIKNTVKAVTGRTYNDPTTLGAWVARFAENMYMSNDPVVKNLTIEDFLRTSAKFKSDTGANANIPTRQIYQKTPEQIDADINELSQRVLGRTVTDADKQADWYQDLTKGINKMLGKGVVTEVKEVKNPKTGKMEKQVIQAPGFSTEAISERITGALEAADPMALERTKNLEFANWAFQKMGGRG